MNSPGQIQNAQRLLDELTYQTNLQRIPVSAAASQLVDFVVNNQTRDFLLVKPPDNPFKPKSSCMFL